MKSFTKLLSMTTLLFIAAILNNVNAATVNFDGIQYQVDYSTNTAVCIANKSHRSSTLTIPKEIPTLNGYNARVVEIAPGAFKNAEFQTVVLKCDLREIGESAFEGNSNLSEVLFMGSTDSIGKSAFAECVKLKNITFHNETVAIGESAFQNCDLRNIQFGTELRYIGKHAFANNNLKELNLPAKLEVIDDGAFSNAYLIEIKYTYATTYQLSIPASVIRIGSKAFDLCPFSEIRLESGDKQLKLGYDSFPEYPDFSKRKYFNTIFYLGRNIDNENSPFNNSEYLRELRIEEPVTEIAASQFENCKKLMTITCHRNFHKIGKKAFKDCDNLTSVGFFDRSVSLEEVGDSAFFNCRIKSTICFAPTVKSIGEYCFANNSNLFYVYFTENRNVNKIPKGCFTGCSCDMFQIYESMDTLCIESMPSSIKTLAILSPIDSQGWEWISELSRNSVETLYCGIHLKEIPDEAFYNCSSLIKLDLGEGLTKIGSKAFSWAAIESLSVPSTVREIGYEAFSFCSNLKHIKLGGGNNGNADTGALNEKLDSIASECFYGSLNIEKIDCYNPQPPVIAKNTFVSQVYENAILRVPIGAKYPETPYWEDFIKTREQSAALESLVLNKKDITVKVNEHFFISRKLTPNIVDYYDGTAWTVKDVITTRPNGGLELEYQGDGMMLVHSNAPGKYKIICTHAIDKYFDLPIPLQTVADTCLVVVKSPEIKSFEMDIPSEIYVGKKVPIINIHLETDGDYPLDYADILIENCTPEKWSVGYDRKKQTLEIKPRSIGIGRCILRDAATNNIIKELEINIKSPIISLEFPHKSVELYVGELIVLPYMECLFPISNLNSNIVVSTIEGSSDIARISDPLSIDVFPENVKGWQITGVNPGKIKVVVESTDGSSLHSECEITVLEANAKEIIINKEALGIAGENLEMNVGESKLIGITVLPDITKDKSVTFVSSNPEVASIDENGNVTALSFGTTVITITANSNPEVKATLNVVVLKPLAQSIEVEPTSVEAIVGDEIQLIAKILPELVSQQALEWESSDSDVASVSSCGLVKILKEGSVVIVVRTTDGSSLHSECEITILEANAKEIIINKEALGIAGENLEMNVGENKLIGITVLPDITKDKSVTFVSSNPEVAGVDENGNVTALSFGTTVITITANSNPEVKATLNVVVLKPLAQSIEVEPTSVEAIVGDEIQLIAKILPELVSQQALEWESSDSDVASVSPSGLVKILKEGSAVIEVHTTDGSNLTATCNVSGMSSIESILADVDTGSVDIYNLQGICIKLNASLCDIKALSQGFYIISGRKVLIK